MLALVPFLPLKQAPQSDPSMTSEQALTELVQGKGAGRRVPFRQRALPPPDENLLSKPLAGSQDPVPPAIDEPAPWQLKDDAAGQTLPPEEGGGCQRLRPPGIRTPEDAQLQTALQKAANVIAEATRRAQWDDPRVDQVVQAMRDNLYVPGTLEAELATRRHKVTAYGTRREGGIHEQALSRCRDQNALSQVRQGAAPIEKKLRGYQWFGQRHEAMLERFQTSGVLDPRSLHRLATSSLLRRRWRRCSVTDYRGRPVVILAKDGSSSNTLATTFAGKILASAFLRVQRRARIRLFAADYSSDRGGHLVQWLYHPRKTPGRGPIQSADAVASLPPKGQGGNEDVLSISHIMREVLKVPSTQKQTLIAINITDGKFNSPIDEFRSMVRELREEHRLTYSLVVLGETPVEVPQADHILRIPQTELQDSNRIAERIAEHVNVLVRRLRGEGRSARV
jgi:hypothetical protein